MILRENENSRVYSDGYETEERMLEIAKKYPEEMAQEFIKDNSEYIVNNTFSETRHNILNWYPFKSNAEILEIGAGMGAITGMLCDRAKSVTALEMSDERAAVIRARYPKRDNLKVVSEDIFKWTTDKKYDYVVFVGVLEYAAIFSNSKNPYNLFISKVRNLLNEEGTLLFAIENKYGLKYWVGGSEDHLQQPFKGIEGYCEPNTAKTFSRAELQELLEKEGFGYNRFYSIYPDYKFPEVVCADEVKPNYMGLQKVHFTYSKNSELIVDERKLYKDIIENDVWQFFANSFLVEAKLKEDVNPYVIYVSAKGECKHQYKVSTVIMSDGVVKKVPMNLDARTHIEFIQNNTELLKKRGVCMIDTKVVNNELYSEYVKYMGAQEYFVSLLKENNYQKICELVLLLKESILKSSEREINQSIINEIDSADKNIDYGIILKDGFVDLTLYNAFFHEGVLYFYDQEWKFDFIPLNFILYYGLKTSYIRSGVNTDVTFEWIMEICGIDDKQIRAYEKLEAFIWKKVLYRQNDFYGEGGYCNRFNDSITLSEKKAELNSKIEEKNQEIEEKNQEIEEKNQEIEEKNQEIEEKNQEIEEKNQEIEENKQKVEGLIEDFNIQLNNKHGHIELLLEQERAYINLLNSKGVRMLKVWWGFKNWLLPQGSKRRFIAKLLKKFVKHPIYMLKKCTPSRIKRTLKYMNNEDGSMLENRLEAATISADDDIERMRLELLPINHNISSIHDVEKLELPVFDDIKVSIIIPVYNQFYYTYNCIKSIINNTQDVAYEVILADDCSTDLTSHITEVVKNIVVAKTPENMRFLRNCNNAAKYVKGDYIFFLNNDTQVQENWLSSLVELAESDDSIGMVGSKLLYPDGALQEAGGILWKDGSAWNYGNKKGPLEAEYNYVKEADYISGAAIMIRRSLWDEIGGFDDNFAPAYYEDTDLAFEVRKHGYKVVYQPLSVVVHFEGISNGTDTSSGQKEYQIVNQKKFYDKWKEVLKKDHFPNAENVFIAKDRSRYKKQILVVDHYVPHHDKDAGGKCTFMYLKLFVKMGMKVTFIGDNFYPHQPYTQELNQMGIEVLYGNFYYNNWQNWIKENGKFFDYVYLQRPHISVKYIDIVKEYTNAKIFYFAHDLHHIREMREYELTGDESKKKSAEHWKEIEYDLFRKTDVGHVVGSYEQSIMQQAFPDTPVRNIPLYMYNEIPESINKDFSTREDIMYVGGFGHPPNIDAVLWFGKEVFPKVLEKYPNMKWYVVGSKVTSEIQALASDNIKILGFVSDEELEKLYRKCRMAIVPLRVGAGVKGKVVESAYYQIPLVTTSIGAEGLDAAVGNMVVEDDADKMANVVKGLYEEFVQLKKMSDAGEVFIEKYFTEEEAMRILNLDL